MTKLLNILTILSTIVLGLSLLGIIIFTQTENKEMINIMLFIGIGTYAIISLPIRFLLEITDKE